MASHHDVIIVQSVKDAFLRWIITVYGLSTVLEPATTSSFSCLCCTRSWRQQWILLCYCPVLWTFSDKPSIICYHLEILLLPFWPLILYIDAVLNLAFALSLLCFVIMHTSLLMSNTTSVEVYEKKRSTRWKYDLGRKKNFEQVFGTKKLLWFLPLFSEEDLRNIPALHGLNFPTCSDMEEWALYRSHLLFQNCHESYICYLLLDQWLHFFFPIWWELHFDV